MWWYTLKLQLLYYTITKAVQQQRETPSTKSLSPVPFSHTFYYTNVCVSHMSVSAWVMHAVPIGISFSYTPLLPLFIPAFPLRSYYHLSHFHMCNFHLCSHLLRLVIIFGLLLWNTKRNLKEIVWNICHKMRYV